MQSGRARKERVIKTLLYGDTQKYDRIQDVEDLIMAVKRHLTGSSFSELGIVCDMELLTRVNDLYWYI
jgi:hypothetical protein